jgi:hypothetical protein
MVGIYKGGTAISGLNLGSSGVKEVYVGGTKVWPAGDAYDAYIYSLETGSTYITHFIGDDYGPSGTPDIFYLYESQGKGPLASQNDITNDPNATLRGVANPWASRFPSQANAAFASAFSGSTGRGNFRGFTIPWAQFGVTGPAIVPFTFICPMTTSGTSLQAPVMGAQNVNFANQRSGLSLSLRDQWSLQGRSNNSDGTPLGLGPTGISQAAVNSHVQMGQIYLTGMRLCLNGVNYSRSTGVTFNFAGQDTYNVFIGYHGGTPTLPVERLHHRSTHINGKFLTQAEMTNVYNLWVSPNGFVNTSVLPSTQIYTGGKLRQHSSSLGIDPADSSTWPDKPLPNGVQIDDPPQFLQTYWATGIKP